MQSLRSFKERILRIVFMTRALNFFYGAILLWHKNSNGCSYMLFVLCFNCLGKLISHLSHQFFQLKFLDSRTYVLVAG